MWRLRAWGESWRHRFGGTLGSAVRKRATACPENRGVPRL